MKSFTDPGRTWYTSEARRIIENCGLGSNKIDIWSPDLDRLRVCFPTTAATDLSRQLLIVAPNWEPTVGVESVEVVISACKPMAYAEFRLTPAQQDQLAALGVLGQPVVDIFVIHRIASPGTTSPIRRAA